MLCKHIVHTTKYRCRLWGLHIFWQSVGATWSAYCMLLILN